MDRGPWRAMVHTVTESDLPKATYHTKDVKPKINNIYNIILAYSHIHSKSLIELKLQLLCSYESHL